jgi:hypothetical protein
MLTRSRSARLALTAALLLSAACSDGTGPAPANFDPVQTDADLNALADVAGNPSLESFNVMSGYFSVSQPVSASSASARVLSSMKAPLTSVTARKVAEQTARSLATRLFKSGSSVPSLEVLPPDQLGTTYIFDDATAQYVASTREGAPANGVRFVLYALDPVSEAPIVGTETGYVDIIDTSAGSQTTAGLRLLVVSGGTTYLDYAFSASATINSAQLSVAGFMTDGTTRLNFDIDFTLAEGSNQSLDLSIDFNFAIPSRGFSVDGSVQSSGGTSNAIDETLTIKSGGASVRYDIVFDESSVNATILVNNKIFATITGDPDAPAVAGASGEELTPEETATLVRLLNIADDAFELFNGLLTPLSELGAPLPL